MYFRSYRASAFRAIRCGIGYMLHSDNNSSSSSSSALDNCQLIGPLTEYDQHYYQVSGNVTGIVSDTSDDLWFLNGR